MLCQNCKINESTIHLYTNMNGKQHQVDLCQNCYQIMKTDPNSTLLRGMSHQSNHNLDPFDDFFKNIGNFQNNSEPNTPPTQSGGGYGGGGYGSSNNQNPRPQSAAPKQKGYWTSSAST